MYRGRSSYGTAWIEAYACVLLVGLLLVFSTSARGSSEVETAKIKRQTNGRRVANDGAPSSDAAPSSARAAYSNARSRLVSARLQPVST